MEGLSILQNANPEVFANKLYHVLSSSLDLDSRTISATLLRESLINKFDTPFLHFPPETQSTLKRDLMKLVDTPVNLDKELHSVLLQRLTQREGEDVCIAVWGAAINFILCLEQKDLVQKDLVNFQDMLTAMIFTLKALYSGNETMANAVNTLKLLINLAGMKPTFLRNQIVEMVQTKLLMTYDPSLEKGTRRLAIEFVLTLLHFILTLAEVEKTNPRQLRLGTEFEINMETDNYGSWQGCADQLANFWDKDDILAVALEVFPAYLAAPKGQRRHAELIALSKSIIKWNCREECLLKEREWDVRVAALGAAINFILCPDFLTLMLSMLEDVLEDRDEAAVSEVLKLLTELVEPRFLVGQIIEWVNTVWQIVNDDSLNKGMRCLAIEFLSKLVQVEEIASWLQQNVRKLCEIFMNMLDDVNDDDPNANYMSAWKRSNNWSWTTCLDKLFIAVGWNDMFSVVLEVLPAYLDAPEWQKKHSAFMVLAHSVESCKRPLIFASKVLASTLNELLQVGFHLAFPALTEVMNDSPNQDMRDNAASIILDFSKYCTRDNLREHSNGIIGSCLIVSKEVWKFLPRIVSQPNLLLLRRSLFGEWEMPSLREILEGFPRTWEERLSKAWIEIWRNEERDFSPYLKILMFPLFYSSAELDPDDPDEPWYDIFYIMEKSKACHVLCFCVDELTEKLFPLIYEVANALIPFLKWYHDTPDTVLPRQCYYDEVVLPAKAIRIAAASAMPKILDLARNVVRSSDPEDYDLAMQYVEELSDMVIGALNEASDVEPDEEVRYDILDALNDCMQ